jgi:4-diphosphocytidyl-2-C-methyl-D-erythritol kinase
MSFRRDEYKRTALAPAKINLYLELLGRRSDGYHELESLMLPVRLCDSLSLVPASPAPDGGPGDIRLDIRPSSLLSAIAGPRNLPPSGGTNLVVRALRLLQERSGCACGAQVELVKRIPIQSGLGGGSSDAAAALRLGNLAWRLGWSRERLAELAAELGADVPFFLYHGPAVCRGRGERVEPVTGVIPLHFVIVKPSEGLSTEGVYRAHDARPTSQNAGDENRVEALVRALRCGCWSELRSGITNRLEAAAAAICPWVRKARALFDQFDFLAHQLSGSGTAYFGVCRHRQQARRLASLLAVRQAGFVYVTRSYP